MKKLIFIFLLVIVVVCFVFTTGFAEKQILRIYTALDIEETKYYTDAFEKETGMSIEIVRMSSGEIAARVEAESANPQTCVWHGGTNTDFINSAQKGLLEPYKPNMDFELLELFHGEDWSWSGFYLGAIGFISNTNFLEEKNVAAPTAWADLMKAEFENNVAIAFPYTSGTAYTAYATLVQLMGLEEALDWWEKFDEHSIFQYTKGGFGCIPMVGLGEVGVGIVFSQDIVSMGINAGYPVVMTFPSEGTGYEVGGIALIKGGPNPELGKQFIDWCFTKRAQDLFQKWSRLPVHPEATVGEDVVTLDKIKLIDYDHIWAGEHKDELLAAWRDRIGQ